MNGRRKKLCLFTFMFFFHSFTLLPLAHTPTHTFSVVFFSLEIFLFVTMCALIRSFAYDASLMLFMLPGPPLFYVPLCDFFSAFSLVFCVGLVVVIFMRKFLFCLGCFVDSFFFFSPHKSISESGNNRKILFGRKIKKKIQTKTLFIKKIQSKENKMEIKWPEISIHRLFCQVYDEYSEEDVSLLHIFAQSISAAAIKHF